MTAFGYTLSSEEHAPVDLVRNAQQAEDGGFDFCTISDHYHPWVQAQGHSPFVWSVLGAIAARTERIRVGTGVTCPIVRTHPTAIAHASATTAALFEDRFFFGVGTGEALNEHVAGARWPRPEIRLEMLEEAVSIIRALWSGETVDRRGTYYEVENARLFDPPPVVPAIVVSGFGPNAVALAARIGDGYWGAAPDPDVVESYRSAGGRGGTFAQIHVCFGPDEDKCRDTVHRIWPNAAIPGQLSQDLPTWTHFEQAAQLVTVDDATEHVPCGPDIEPVVEAARTYVAAGYDHVHLHQIGPDQDALFSVWDRELRDALAGV